VNPSDRLPCDWQKVNTLATLQPPADVILAYSQQIGKGLSLEGLHQLATDMLAGFDSHTFANSSHAA